MGDGASTFKWRKNEVSELADQAMVANLLTQSDVVFAAVPNGHVRTKRQLITAAKEGVKAGMPDMLIFTPPPALYGRVYAVGVALEMKKTGAKSNAVRKNQRAWLRKLAANGWIPVVGYGAADAIAHLQVLGYAFKDFALNDRAVSDTTVRRLAKFKQLVEAGAPTSDYIALHKDEDDG